MCLWEHDIGIGPLYVLVLNGKMNTICKLGKVIYVWTVAFILGSGHSWTYCWIYAQKKYFGNGLWEQSCM